ncbi:MAG: DNA primase [Actinomycetota bacterium]|nr:DNA primase [Actinomycetota bacterium]
MGRITPEDIERVREASDFVAIASENLMLQRAGRKYKACCPFHEEKTPSFQIDPDLKLWHCFGCGEGGDIFDYVGRIHNLDFPDSVRFLADKAHIELVEVEGTRTQPRGHKERLKAACAAAEEFYHHELMRSSGQGAAAARSYLAGRGFGSEVCKRWKLGYAPGHGALRAHLAQEGFTLPEMVEANLVLQRDGATVRDRFFNRVMFPIHDRLGKSIAFGGRIIGQGEPKYLNSSETPVFHKSSNLFAIDRARNHITTEACAIVVEGYTDVIALHEAGIANVVATLGTALTQQHVRMLRNMRPKRIVYLFDGDSAGQKAADRATEFIDVGMTPEAGSDYVEFQVAVLPDDLDPADFVAERGADALREVIDGAVPLIRFAIDRRLEAWDLSNPGQRAKALEEAVALLAPIKQSLIAADYANYIADALHADVQVCLRALAQANPRRRPRPDEDVPGQRPVRPQAHVETADERTQRELLTLLVTRPGLLDACEGMDLSKVGWILPVAKQVAEVLVQADVLQEKDVLQRVMQLEGTAAFLAAGTLDSLSDAEALDVAWVLYRQARERQLEKDIRSATIALKNLNPDDVDEYKKYFELISALQQDLKKLRMMQTGR